MADNNDSRRILDRVAGFRFKRDGTEDQKNIIPSVVPPTNDDGSIPIDASGYNVWGMDFNGVYKSETELVRKYRDVALQPEVDSAIEDIVNEALVMDEQDDSVSIVLDELKQPNHLKKMIEQEFENILLLLNFNTDGQEWFRRWYVDGRIYFHTLIDPNNYKNEGIHELRYISPLEIKKIREERRARNNLGVEVVEKIDEFYAYTPSRLYSYNNMDSVSRFNQPGTTVRLTADSICHVHSGLYDEDKNMIMGWLHKAIKPINQLRMQEDAVIIYRLSRAPNRRIFYIDVGNMPKVKAEQYIKQIMNKYKNRMTYDAVSGEVKDYTQVLSMMEDFWLPRTGTGRGTEVTQMEGATNLDQLSDIMYFRDRVMLALNVPLGRLQHEKTGFTFGRASEISREEIKFSKFIGKLRSRFNDLFYELLRTQLLLKGIIKDADWEEMRHQIFFRYVKDSHFAELKEIEVMQDKVVALQQIDPYVGVYFSKAWVRQHILHFNDEEVDKIAKEIETEKQDIQNDDEIAPLASPLSPLLNPGGDNTDPDASSHEESEDDKAKKAATAQINPFKKPPPNPNVYNPTKPKPYRGQSSDSSIPKQNPR